MPSSGKVQFGANLPLLVSWEMPTWGVTLRFEIKYAGYDAIILEGMGNRPSVVVIDDDKVEIVDGSKVLGKGSSSLRR